MLFVVQTLVLPIGGAGVGKTTLGHELLANTEEGVLRIFCRDAVYAMLRGGSGDGGQKGGHGGGGLATRTSGDGLVAAGAAGARQCAVVTAEGTQCDDTSAVAALIQRAARPEWAPEAVALLELLTELLHDRHGSAFCPAAQILSREIFWHDSSIRVHFSTAPIEMLLHESTGADDALN
eukprot:SAG11_NODE_1562_length_4676_cov_2.366616_8_plen_179_part_00